MPHLRLILAEFSDTSRGIHNPFYFIGWRSGERALISQTEIRVDYHRRDHDGSWPLNSFRDRSNVISIPDHGLSLPVGDIYRRVF
jgi:hypothetical protein